MNKQKRSLETQITKLALTLPYLSTKQANRLEKKLDKAYRALTMNQLDLAQKTIGQLNQNGGGRITPSDLEYFHNKLVELEAAARARRSDLFSEINWLHAMFDNASFTQKMSRLSDFQRIYRELYDRMQQPKYKRCKNKTAPITLEAVEDVATDDLIVFSNGACWDIEALIDYLKAPEPGGANGQNNAEGIKSHLEGYPSNKIWETNRDYKLMIDHSKAKAADLDRFIKERKYGTQARKISETTMRQLYRTGSLLLSRGPPFESAIREHLNESQLAEWDRVKSGLTLHEMPREISDPQTEIQKDINNIIGSVIKSEAIASLHNHLRGIPTEEKRALESIREGFIATIKQCYEGTYCAMATGDMITSVYNRLVPFKSGFETLT